MAQLAAQKVQTVQLQRLIEEGSDEPLSVLIEVALPETSVETQKTSRGGVTIHVPASIGLRSREFEQEASRVVAESRKILEDNLVTVPRWLESSGVFVATATPKQLRKIAGSPAIKAIWPNREHRVL